MFFNNDETKDWLRDAFSLICIGLIIVLVITGFVASCSATHAVYKVWERGKEGEAELAQAESNRKIKTLEAMAAEESARHLAEAEIIRAEGVAKANQIIGQSLNNNESYLRYLWITNLQSPNKEIIYVPTEANLPITEAGRK